MASILNPNSPDKPPPAPSTTPSLQPPERIGESQQQRCVHHLCELTKPTSSSPHTVSIHILDDNSLLNVFLLYRPPIFDGDEDDEVRLRGGKGWNRERWWYKLVHVCQRWRNLILGSTSVLDVCLVCTYGTPVEDMLAHSPHLPIVIDYDYETCDITAEAEGIILALEQRNRVRRIRLHIPALNLQMFNITIHDEYPVLEYFIMEPSMEVMSTALTLPETLQAPRLRHVALMGFALPIRSQLLTTAVGLVTLVLTVVHPPTYFQPNILLQWLSFMPQLETLVISFSFPVPNSDVEGQLIHMPITLPNLRWFVFRGVSAYVEAVVRRITTPRLEKLGLHFFKQLTFSVPHLLQYINATENLKFDSAKFKFSRDGIYVKLYPHEEGEKDSLFMYVDCWHLDWQVSSVAQIFDSHVQIFSTVEHLTFEYEVHSRSSEEHNEVDRTEWRKLLKSFNSVKTLHVDDGLIKELSCVLQLYDRELPLGLLPELQELIYSGSGDAVDVFTSFIDARQNVGFPVTLTRPFQAINHNNNDSKDMPDHACTISEGSVL